jgi:hypothetical protein
VIRTGRRRRVVRAQAQGDLPVDIGAHETARALLASQQGLVYMGRSGMDVDTLTAAARSLATRLLPGVRSSQ